MVFHFAMHSVHASEDKLHRLTLTQMEEEINSVIKDNPEVDYGISIIDLNDDQQLNFGGSGPMVSASVSKVLTAADFLKQAELGNETTSETLDDGNSAGYDINQAIVVSNDTSWEALNDELSYSQLQDYAAQIGMVSFDATNNLLSAPDTAKLFQLLYEGRLLNRQDTITLLSDLKQANYRSFIVAAVPKVDSVYHKVGEYNDSLNDAAIISRGNKAIVLVILTNGNGSGNWPARTNQIHKLTQTVLDYYGLE